MDPTPAREGGSWAVRARRVAYLGAMVAVAAGLCGLLALMIDWERASWWVAVPWLGGLFLLLLNIGYLVVVSVCSGFVPRSILPEARLDEVPPTALIYVVKNERGALAERMAGTLEGNPDPAVHLWLISNSDDIEVVEQERAAISRLGQRFGPERVHWWRPSDNPRGLKHLAIQEWTRHHEAYRYLLVCDADTVLSPGAVRALAAKAEHPANSHVVLFQAHLVARWSKTRFARYQEPAQNLVHKIFCRVNYHLLGQSAYYGHGGLARRAAFAELDVPEQVMSHDLWDMAALDLAGGTIAFCEDVEAWEMLPANYLVFRARSRRWILGNLQAAPLVLKRGLSLGARFVLSLAIYVYLVQPVLLGWILLGLVANNRLTGIHLASQGVLLGTAKVVDLEMSGVCVATLGVVWLYKVRFCRTPAEVYQMLREVVVGTLLLLNGLFYDSMVVLGARWLDRTWRPMLKDPDQRLSLGECVVQMLPSTAFGALLLVVGLALAPWWALWTSPVLISFLAGGLVVYYTSMPTGSTDWARRRPAAPRTSDASCQRPTAGPRPPTGSPRPRTSRCVCEPRHPG